MPSREEERTRNTMAPLPTASSVSATPSSSSSHHPLPSPPPSASSIAAVGRECAKCLSYLTRVLDGGGGGGNLGATSSSSTASRPTTLLRALGVISPIDGRTIERSEGGNASSSNSDDNGSNYIRKNNKMYELTSNGRGVMIRLENKHANNNINNNNNGGRISVDNEHELQNRENGMGASEENSQHDKQHHQQQQHQVPIHRRLSNAASHLVNNIQGSVHNNNSNKGVLTTSPLSPSPLPSDSHSSTKDNTPSSITITIECSPCGSDTRAEACARAYVRGPDPLGIVLCSNRLSSQREIEEVLVHELVHIYDVHVRQMDLRDCKQLAYSEVRAAREAECANR